MPWTGAAELSGFRGFVDLRIGISAGRAIVVRFNVLPLVRTPLIARVPPGLGPQV